MPPGLRFLGETQIAAGPPGWFEAEVFLEGWIDALRALPCVGRHPEAVSALTNLMPVEMIEASDISNAIAWLASDEARYVTGQTLSVDAGFSVK